MVISRATLSLQVTLLALTIKYLICDSKWKYCERSEFANQSFQQGFCHAAAKRKTSRGCPKRIANSPIL